MDVHVQTAIAFASQLMEPDGVMNKVTKSEVVKLQLNSTSSSHQ
jgi:hypothetical protein